MRRLIILFLVSFALRAQAAESVTICYNYRCAVQAEVTFSEDDMQTLASLFADDENPGDELGAIQLAVSFMSRVAGQQTPIHNDKGGNYDDDGVEGRMDCIDHAHTTTAYLRFIAAHDWLRFYKVLNPIRRAPLLFDDHWAARIQDKQTGAQYAVDSWFFDNGQPPVIYPLERWLSGAHP